MKMRRVATLGAVLLLALGTAVAEAREGGGFGGGGGGGGGGARFSGGGGGGGPSFGGGGGGSRFNGGGNFSGRAFRSGPNFSSGNYRGPGPRGPRFSGDRGVRNYAGNYGKWHGGRHHHRRHGYFIGYPYYYDDGYYGYGYDCDWLYQRAIVTGSPYWWRRYRACEY